MKDDETGSQPELKKSFVQPSSYLNSNRIMMGRTRASSAAVVRNDNSRFSVLRSVSKGIKHHNVTEIISMDLPPVQPLEPEILKPQTKSVMTLKEIRKLYDETLTISNKRQKDLQALRSQNERLKEKQREMQIVTTDIQKLNARIDADRQAAFQFYEDSFWNRKCYENMRHRLISDKQLLAKRLLELEQFLGQKRFIRREVESRYEQTKMESSQAARLLEKMRENLGELEQRKHQKLSMYEQGLQSQYDFKQRQLDKDVKINEIAETAMQEKDNSEKNWKKLLSVHKFVKVMLRQKMERELKKFEVVEMAYQSIKTKTGVWQAEQIVEKFINRDQTYGNLLYSIAEAEKKISASKRRNQYLRSRENQLKDVMNELEKPSKKTEFDLSKQIKAVAKNSRANINAGVMKERLYKFAVVMLKRLDVLEDKDSKDYREEYSKDQVLELYDLLASRLMQLDSTGITQEMSSPESVKKPMGIMNRKNIRVSMDAQESRSDEQSIDMAEEQAQLEAHRNMLENTNAWFFEELRRKQAENMKKRLAEREKQAPKARQPQKQAAQEPQ